MPLRYVFDQNEAVVDFVVRSKLASGATKHAGYPEGRSQAIGIVNDSGELIAGLVYFNYNPEAGTIEFSAEAVHGHRWLTPSTLGVMFQYPFLICGCQMLITKTGDRNEHVKRMLAAMNFSLIRIPRAAGRNEDGIIALLTYEDWIASKFCKRFGHNIGIADAQAVAA